MTRQVMLRLLDTLFRRWWLYLVPVVLLAGLGFMSVGKTKDTYRSIGTMNVEGATFLSELTEVGTDAGFGYDSPANATAARVNAWLQTESFVTQVADRAGLGDDLASQRIVTNDVRRLIGAFPDGSNLVKVVGTTEDPALSQGLVTATIDAFVQRMVDLDVAESRAAEEFFEAYLPTYQAEVAEARSNYEQYLATHPSPSTGAARPESEIAEMTRLTGLIDQAEARYNGAFTKAEEARLATEQIKSDVQQRLQLVDQPLVPTAPEPKLKGMVLSMAAFVFLGLVLAAAGVVLGTALDRSIRSAADVKDRLGARLLAVVPESRTVRRGRSTPAADLGSGALRPERVELAPVVLGEGFEPPPAPQPIPAAMPSLVSTGVVAGPVPAPVATGVDRNGNGNGNGSVAANGASSSDGPGLDGAQTRPHTPRTRSAGTRPRVQLNKRRDA